MRFHAQRQHVVYSLDTLLYQLFFLSYLIDPAFLRVTFRALIQPQLTRPREMGRTVRFYVICLCLLHAPVILRHLFYTFHYDSRGVLLDFVGRAHPPAPIHVVFLDILTFILQVITVIIAHETGPDIDPDMPDPIEYKPSPGNDRDEDEDEESSHKQYYHEPIFHVRLRPTWQSILHPPAPRPPDLPLPGATRRSLGPMRLGRFLTAVQQRMREQAMAMAQASASNEGAISAQGSPTPRRSENELPGAMPPER